MKRLESLDNDGINEEERYGWDQDSYRNLLGEFGNKMPVSKMNIGLDTIAVFDCGSAF